MTINLSYITGQLLEAVHVEGTQSVMFVTTTGEQYQLEGMHLSSYDGELIDLLDGHVETTHVIEEGLMSKRVRVEVIMSTGYTVAFNFTGSSFSYLNFHAMY